MVGITEFDIATAHSWEGEGEGEGGGEGEGSNVAQTLSFDDSREATLLPQPRPATVAMTTIHFPAPHPTSFAVAGAVHPHGAPLVSGAFW